MDGTYTALQHCAAHSCFDRPVLVMEDLPCQHDSFQCRHDSSRLMLRLKDDAVPTKSFGQRLRQKLPEAAALGADVLYLGHIPGAPWRRQSSVSCFRFGGWAVATIPNKTGSVPVSFKQCKQPGRRSFRDFTKLSIFGRDRPRQTEKNLTLFDFSTSSYFKDCNVHS